MILLANVIICFCSTLNFITLNYLNNRAFSIFYIFMPCRISIN